MLARSWQANLPGKLVIHGILKTRFGESPFGEIAFARAPMWSGVFPFGGGMATHNRRDTPIGGKRILIEEVDGVAAASEVQARALAGGLAGVPDKDAIDENPLDARW